MAWNPDDLPRDAEDSHPPSADPKALEPSARQAAPARSTGDVPDGAGDAAGSQPTVAWSAAELAQMAAQEAASEEAERQEDPLVGTLIRDKWRVLERLGAGSFGTVYKVQDVKGRWIEALKVLGVDRLTGAEAEEMRRRFLREAQIMKRLGTD